MQKNNKSMTDFSYWGVIHVRHLLKNDMSFLSLQHLKLPINWNVGEWCEIIIIMFLNI